MMAAYEMEDRELLRALYDPSNDWIKATFEDLIKLTGSEAMALRALKEENRFVINNGYDGGLREHAAQIRQYLVDHKLDWNQENLALAVKMTAH